jgi:hypothetical protein
MSLLANQNVDFISSIILHQFATLTIALPASTLAASTLKPSRDLQYGHLLQGDHNAIGCHSKASFFASILPKNILELGHLEGKLRALPLPPNSYSISINYITIY